MNNTIKVAIIGAGTMGAGLAGEFARAGHSVRLADLNEDLLQTGMANFRKAQQALLNTGHLSPDAAQNASAHVQTTTDLQTACEDAQLLVEAVSENMVLKKDMFSRFDALCPKEAILASNTSGLSITEIASVTQRPNQVAGLHFWNPPHLVPLVEVTKGKLTDDTTANTLMNICRQLGKKPILVQHDIPGLVGNRLQFAVVREALHLYAEGIASAEDIDLAMTAGPGLRYGFLGPLRTADLGGLDIFQAISAYLFAELNSESGTPDILADLVNRGKLGAKTGEGFYPYSDVELDRILAQRDRVLLGFLDVLKREVDDV